jgi:glycosyltransferase involved in cell wall biosynthesis
MKILQVHNFYQQAGGEDQVVAAERALLLSHGHTVLQYTVHNDDIQQMSSLALGAATIWNQETYRRVQRLISEQSVELMHLHNTLPLISPSVIWAAAAEKAAVIQTLHNYRLLCPAATFYRDGAVCELCLPKTAKWPAVIHRCYRGSRIATAGISTMLGIHHMLGTYQRKVDAYIALTEFARAKFCEGGLPCDRVKVKPNFIMNDPGIGRGTGGYALFAGRLTEEKGLTHLLDAWSQCSQALPLKIVGDGPQQPYVRERTAALPNVAYLGPCAHERVIELLQDAKFLILPSRWYEGLPMVAVEAMACGTPVVAFGLGSMNDLITDGVNGLKLAIDRPNALVDFLRNSEEFLRNPLQLRAGARAHFERNFTADTNYDLLLTIYEQAVNRLRSIS